MEEDDMVKSRAIPRVQRETNRWGRKGLQAQGAYKEVPKDPLHLALLLCVAALTEIGKNIGFKWL